MIEARGYPLSALFPATMPIYRSLGWELAGGRYEAAVPTRSLHRLLPPDPSAASAHDAPGESLRRAGPRDAAAVLDIIDRCHEEALDSGGLTWDEPLTARWLSRPDMYAYLTGDGFAAYRWADANKTLLVERAQAASPRSLRALWSVIASHGSTVPKIRARVGPNDPFWWLTHERDAAITKRSMWMLRVVDAPAAIAARGFPPAVTLSVPLVIEDGARRANSGRWQLSVSDGKGILIPNGPVVPPASPLPLTLGARGLAALYAGTPVSTLRLAGLASGGDSDAGALDAAFAATPYTLDDF
jgi:predicted acetyltransferase